MCGIAGILGPHGLGPEGGAELRRDVRAMVDTQHHRGPDAEGIWQGTAAPLVLGHNRLSILDLSERGKQPMASADGRLRLVYNGEIYNYRELRAELSSGWSFRTETDTEVLLAAWCRWGEACLHRFVGMFAFALWDEESRSLFLARDRFGVKPLHVHRRADGAWVFASELEALFRSGAPREPDPATWATYLSLGLYDHGTATFWRGIERLPAGGYLRIDAADTAHAHARSGIWYDAGSAALEAGPDLRDEDAVAEELEDLLVETVRLRLRSDVEVGLCLSGGFDSSLLLALLRRAAGADVAVRTYTFVTGDPRYDERPWVEAMLEGTGLRPRFVHLEAHQVPDADFRMGRHQGEPYGGVPTLAMGRLFEAARDDGVGVLLDGNGLDEAWAGYDYYARAAEVDPGRGPVQGARSSSVRPEVLDPSFARLARPFEPPRPFGDPVADLQYRDLATAKIPRAMRFADRASMAASRELREPFLDHRLVELGLRQPAERKIGRLAGAADSVGKLLPRRVAAELVPLEVGEAPKRPVQTPQREWLRGELADWAEGRIERALLGEPGRSWLRAEGVRRAFREYRAGRGDNSFPIWQWISLGALDAREPEEELPAAGAASARA
ncbi:MAG: asparagine synthase (glutamine-hydrolyzing) [Holophagales bacterium]|nr:asparagine synthase (glutamine-hydrolyzing) [Holophagales bacterium]